jgi:hypothetical protein
MGMPLTRTPRDLRADDRAPTPQQAMRLAVVLGMEGTWHGSVYSA